LAKPVIACLFLRKPLDLRSRVSHPFSHEATECIERGFVGGGRFHFDQGLHQFELLV
jgi:hypothetical protein